MKAIVNKDLVISVVIGDVEALNIPEYLQNLPNYQLRFDGQKIVDASTYTTFYIDENGIKHIVQHDPSWQELQCKFDDILVKDSDTGNWRAMTEEEIKEQKEKERIQELSDACKNYILSFYPAIKQQSDIADKVYFETVLKAVGISNLEADIIKRVEDFYNGKTLDEVISDVADENKEAYLQLIKVGVRVNWVQRCKEVLRDAIANSTKPNFPKFPLE